MTTKAYDPTNSVQVYNAIQAVYPGIRHFTPQTVAPFIPAGADPTWWCKVLRNVEHNLNSAPKPKRSRRTNCNQPRKTRNYAEIVTRRTTFDSLM